MNHAGMIKTPKIQRDNGASLLTDYHDFSLWTLPIQTIQPLIQFNLPMVPLLLSVSLIYKGHEVLLWHQNTLSTLGLVRWLIPLIIHDFQIVWSFKFPALDQLFQCMFSQFSNKTLQFSAFTPLLKSVPQSEMPFLHSQLLKSILLFGVQVRCYLREIYPEISLPLTLQLQRVGTLVLWHLKPAGIFPISFAFRG